MNYLFDSDMVSILYDDTRTVHHESLHRKVSGLEDEDGLMVSVVVLYELEYSFYNAPDHKKAFIRDTIHSVLRDFNEVIPLDETIAPVFGEIKAKLKERKGIPRNQMRKHNIDIMLASTAICRTFVLVGADRIYAEIADLNPLFRFENWGGSP